MKIVCTALSLSIASQKMERAQYETVPRYIDNSFLFLDRKIFVTDDFVI